jgi:flagellar basal body rod protein FlgB
MNANIPLAIDNICELLVKVLEFTQSRQNVLTSNINNVHSPGFVPMDLDVTGFSAVMDRAVEEHLQSSRLVFFDTPNVKFGPGGSFEVRPIVDNYSKMLLDEDTDAYLEFQINKLLENSLNQKVAAELIKKRKEMISLSE